MFGEKGSETSMGLLQEVVLLGIARILRKVFGDDVAESSEGLAVCPSFW